ncbi:G patch domain-containing protein 4 [Araneus ventricosus]|uniref:G patch domain-containing protein 4 n=1 Tax=Araneus ventricosus TaxID=182803 RepID=A0A4Y2DC81_ARAVE|nr:G patch domain-containing protein 4 [Araneus ventricosus]
MNDFARKQLEKYGWKDGKGLGKEENGISQPVKTVVKNNKHGIGHDNSNILTSRWWCDVFNKAAQQISVVNTKTGVSVSSAKKIEEPTLITPDRISKIFVKAETSVNDDETTGDDSRFPNSASRSKSFNSSGDELYRKCKEAKESKCGKFRKAKLKRIQRQDEYLKKKQFKHKKAKER